MVPWCSSQREAAGVCAFWQWHSAEDIPRQDPIRPCGVRVVATSPADQCALAGWGRFLLVSSRGHHIDCKCKGQGCIVFPSPFALFHCLSDLNCMRHCPTVVLLFVTLACTHAIVSLCRSLQREVTLLRRWCYNAAMTPPCTWFVGRSMIAPLSLACIRNSHGSRSTTSGCDVVAAPLPAAAVLVTCYPECHV